MIDGSADPSFGAGLTGSGDGPEAPDAFAGGGFVGGEEAADAFVAAGDTGNYQIADSERGLGGAVILMIVDHFGVPDELAGVAVKGDEMGVVCDHEDAIAEDGDAAIDAGDGVTGGDEIFGAGAGVVPELAAGAGVEGEAFVGAGDVHDAVDDLRRIFESAAGTGHDPHPARGELGDVGAVDFGERAEAVATDVCVVAGPFAFDGVGDAREVDAFAEIEGWERDVRGGGVALQSREIGDEIFEVAGRGAQYGHKRSGVAIDVGDLVFGQEVQVVVEAHEFKVEVCFATEGAADCLAVGEGDRGGGVGDR